MNTIKLSIKRPSLDSITLEMTIKSPWAREKVEQLYLQYAEDHAAHD